MGSPVASIGSGGRCPIKFAKDVVKDNESPIFKPPPHGAITETDRKWKAPPQTTVKPPPPASSRENLRKQRKLEKTGETWKLGKTRENRENSSPPKPRYEEPCEKAMRKRCARVATRSEHLAQSVYAPSMDMLGFSLVYLYII